MVWILLYVPIIWLGEVIARGVGTGTVWTALALGQVHFFLLTMTIGLLGSVLFIRNRELGIHLIYMRLVRSILFAIYFVGESFTWISSIGELVGPISILFVCICYYWFIFLSARNDVRLVNNANNGEKKLDDE